MSLPDEVGKQVEKATKDAEPRAMSLYEWVGPNRKLMSLDFKNGNLSAILMLDGGLPVNIEVPDYVTVNGKQLKAYLP